MLSFASHQIFHARPRGPPGWRLPGGAAGIEVPRVTFPSLEKGSDLMTKADFGDFTYAAAALAFLVIMLVFLGFVIEWWQGKE
jgi:hypothetical protein